ncbi:MAG TPA: arginase family protein [Propionibacteriaceae bacterium]|nr:arginase family protein [Propionibacteriaceae bacterium]
MEDNTEIDVVDPGYAPGTGTPEPGGMSPREHRHLRARQTRAEREQAERERDRAAGIAEE